MSASLILALDNPDKLLCRSRRYDRLLKNIYSSSWQEIFANGHGGSCQSGSWIPIKKSLSSWQGGATNFRSLAACKANPSYRVIITRYDATKGQPWNFHFPIDCTHVRVRVFSPDVRRQNRYYANDWCEILNC